MVPILFFSLGAQLLQFFTVSVAQQTQGPQWLNRTIPYTIDANFPQDKLCEIYKAMNDYEAKTCIRFPIKSSSDSAWVHFGIDDNACGAADNCYHSGQRNVVVGGGCVDAKVMAHELGHVLCISHEQDRPDRDDFIDFADGCTPSKKFDWRDPRMEDLFYDYISIMHYESSCFIPKLPGVTKIGGGPKSGGPLTVLDAEKVNAYYNCGGCLSYRYEPVVKIQQYPFNSLIAAGYDGNSVLYPCRMYHNGDIIPGKGTTNQCWVSYGGEEYTSYSNFELLTNPQSKNFDWTSMSSGDPLPSNTIPGGRDAEGEKLYIGRCTLTINGRTTQMAGKLQLSASENLYVPYGGKEYECSTFDLLTCSEMITVVPISRI